MPITNDYPILFIGGLHRSATTLLGRLLSQHPDICGLEDTGVIEDEGQFLQDIYPNDNIAGGPGRFAFDPTAHLRGGSPQVTGPNAEMLWKSWSPYWRSDAKWCVEKTPGNLIKAGFLQGLFPRARFLFVSRHPIATSLATYKWSGTGIYSLVHHWCHAHELMRSDFAELRHVLHVSYESLMEMPQSVLVLIEELLGLRSFDYELGLDTQSNQCYFQKWDEVFLSNPDRSKPVPSLSDFREMADLNSFASFRRKFRRNIRIRLYGETRQFSQASFEAQDAVSMFESRVNQFGYSLIDKEQRPGLPMWMSKADDALVG